MHCNFYFSKLQEYAPSEPQKAYEKSLTRRPNVPIFHPLSALQELDPEVTAQRDTPDGRYRLVNQFVNVSYRIMMLTKTLVRPYRNYEQAMIMQYVQLYIIVSVSCNDDVI